MGHFAFHVLELDRRVVDAEGDMQAILHVAQDAFADGRWYICDRNVARQRTSFRADVPAVQVVDVVYSFN